jgi:hypothetical protein
MTKTGKKLWTDLGHNVVLVLLDDLLLLGNLLLPREMEAILFRVIDEERIIALVGIRKQAV